jgi:hypothetical protein
VFGVEDFTDAAALIVLVQFQNVNEVPAGDAEEHSGAIHVNWGDLLRPFRQRRHSDASSR